eukprot:CAMPEP_0174381530 /NCGR_PEP_ID=MMETSP0811_2-20130205/124071_1 /TAXON_ID=73025 ORGANISM="Eutreptiella gymnastica-like, Strain CCMP1594" /NCGR_SAMPLE_ID=MMETSP0811_2 /ASSEMBLY_ACC=CAM_ASM_000667 /LENGTH=46 /DNA_ID= /DNA_START= /DNA_END= /DNA_ORIENTATION=
MWHQSVHILNMPGPKTKVRPLMATLLPPSVTLQPPSVALQPPSVTP